MADGKRALTASLDKTVRLWELATGKELRLYEGCPESMYEVALTRDEKYLLAPSSSGRLWLWEFDNPTKPIRSFVGHSGIVVTAAFTDVAANGSFTSWGAYLPGIGVYLNPFTGVAVR